MALDFNMKFLQARQKSHLNFRLEMWLMIPVLLFCALAVWGAWNTLVTLSRLQKDYLRNQALLIASSLEDALRGTSSRFIGTDNFSNPKPEAPRVELSPKGNDGTSSRFISGESANNPHLVSNQQKLGLKEDDVKKWADQFDTVLANFEMDFAELCLVNSVHQILYHTKVQQRGKILTDPGLDPIFQARELYCDRVINAEGKTFYQLLLPFYVYSRADDRSDVLNIGDSMVLMVSLDASRADFILYPGKINLMLVGIACVFLLILWFILRKYIQRVFVLRRQEAEQQKWAVLGQMSAALAHEIRNPLGAVKGLAQLLREGKQNSENQSRYLITIIEESQRLEKLVSDLLIFAKPVSPQKSEFQLDSLVEDLHHLFRSEMEKRHIRFEYLPVRKQISIFADYELLRRILINLIDNAMHAMPEGGKILFRAEIKAKNICFQIEDEGEGLPSEPDQVFEPFFSTKATGTGLGLAISRQLADAMGGSIRLENRPEKGASCTVTLPV
jgi:two-component system sensor histidine kinase HydH